MKKMILLSALVFFAVFSARPLQARERVTVRGTEVFTNGDMPAVGVLAPEFSGVDSGLREVSLASFRGKKVLLNIFPSLDTRTCALSVREFNRQAAALENTVVLCISMDLPFAQSRFCAAEGIERVVPLSVFRSEEFRRYGLMLEEGPMRGLTARAVLVLDESGRVVYRELVRNLSDEPDYAEAIRHLEP